MNERIKELNREAQSYATKIVGDDVDYFNVWVDIYKDKLAELIVQECARIARATPCPYEEDEVRQRLGHTWDMASLEAGREIKQHFGVEE